MLPVIAIETRRLSPASSEAHSSAPVASSASTSPFTLSKEQLSRLLEIELRPDLRPAGVVDDSTGAAEVGLAGGDDTRAAEGNLVQYVEGSQK